MHTDYHVLFCFCMGTLPGNNVGTFENRSVKQGCIKYTNIRNVVMHFPEFCGHYDKTKTLKEEACYCSRTKDHGPFNRDPYPRTLTPGPFTPGPIPQDHLPQDPYPGTIYPRTHTPGPFTPGPLPQDHLPQDPYPRTIYPRTLTLGPFTLGPLPQDLLPWDPYPGTIHPGTHTHKFARCHHYLCLLLRRA